eukprot:Hpha_TRINITY_DN13327_c0_g3::TRINITY_DN13327_c0_g3_i1::g.95635::m.95635
MRRFLPLGIVVLTSAVAAAKCGCDEDCMSTRVASGEALAGCFELGSGSPTVDCSSSGCSMWVSWGSEDELRGFGPFGPEGNESSGRLEADTHTPVVQCSSAPSAPSSGGKVCFDLICALGDGMGSSGVCTVRHTRPVTVGPRTRTSHHADLDFLTTVLLVLAGTVGCTVGWVLLNRLKGTPKQQVREEVTEHPGLPAAAGPEASPPRGASESPILQYAEV